jgi:hypothetical protein
MTINDNALVPEIDVHHGNEIKKKPYEKHLFSAPLRFARISYFRRAQLL